MTASQRRESILEAAARAFARTGYAGTSTATIADEAHVSQPYVIQMFGSKGRLFRLVYERSDQEIQRCLLAALRESAYLGLDPTEQVRRATWSLMDRLPDRTHIQIVLHGLLGGNKCPEVAELARLSIVRLHRTVEETTGCSKGQSGNVLGHVILAGALLSIDASADAAEPVLADLSNTAFGSAFVERLRAEAS